MTEHRDLRKLFEIAFFVILILIALSYGIWKAYPLLAGPKIVVTSPLHNATVSTSTFEITGYVARVKEITLQGRPIPIGTNGEFREILVADYPYTTIILSATDFYGKTVTKTLQVSPQK